MQKTILLLAGMLGFAIANAQLAKTDEWKKSLATENKDTVAWVRGGVVSLGVNQGFLHNWAAGGEVASMTVNGTFSGYLNRIIQQNIWANNLDLTYGLFYGYSNRFVPRKIDDRIDFTSKYGVQLGKNRNLFLSALVNFKSQFTRGYDYSVTDWVDNPTSEFLSPAYITTAIGIEYRRGTNLSLFLSPIAARVTLANKRYTILKPEGAFGIEHGKTSRTEFGAYFSGRYQVEVNKRLLFKTRMDLYMNYLAKDKKDSLGMVVRKDSPGNVDILWDNFLSWKLAKYLSVTVGATFIYDNDLPYQATFTDAATGAEQSKDEPGEGLGWWQVKQLFTLGLEYRL